MKYRLLFLLLVPVMAAFMAVPAGASTHVHHGPPPPPSGTTHIWYGNGFTLTNKFVTGDSATASYFMNQSNSYGTGSSTSSNPISNSYATTPCLRYQSDAQFETDISMGTIPNTTWPTGSCVVYDNEAQTGTPMAEQLSPETYMPQFNDDAIDAGFVPWDTPALDLGNTDTTCPKSTHGGTNLAWYEQCHIAQYAVQVAGELTTTFGAGVVVQNQTQLQDGTCSNSSDYATLYKDAESDVDGVNAGSSTLAEVSINYPSGDTTSQAATAAKTCLSGLGGANVDGVYVDTTNTDAATAEGYTDEFFEDMKSAGW